MKSRIITLFTWVGMLFLAICAVPLFGLQAEAMTFDPATAGLIGVGGLIINASTLSSIFINLKTTFNKAFEGAPSHWEKVAMLVPSGAAQNDYKWLSNFPRMRKWIGEKSVKALAAFGYTIVNDDWEATVEVDRNDIEDDQLGIYAPQAQMAGFSAKQLPDEIIADLENGVFTKLCFDGQYMCDTDHVVAGASVSNKGTKALNASTQAAAIASLGAGITAMMSFKDDEGRPLNTIPNILLVPPALKDTANILATNEKLDDGKPNPYRGTIEVVVNARLTSATAWFLLDTTKPVRPFIYQERKKPVFVQQIDPQADDVFMRKKFKFGAEARCSGGYGFWQLIWGSTGADA